MLSRSEQPLKHVEQAEQVGCWFRSFYPHLSTSIYLSLSLPLYLYLSSPTPPCGSLLEAFDFHSETYLGREQLHRLHHTTRHCRPQDRIPLHILQLPLDRTDECPQVVRGGGRTPVCTVLTGEREHHRDRLVEAGEGAGEEDF